MIDLLPAPALIYKNDSPNLDFLTLLHILNAYKLYPQNAAGKNIHIEIDILNYAALIINIPTNIKNINNCTNQNILL